MIFAILFFLVGRWWWRKAAGYGTVMRWVSRTFAGLFMLYGVAGLVGGIVALFSIGLTALVSVVPNVPQTSLFSPSIATPNYPATIVVLERKTENSPQAQFVNPTLTPPPFPIGTPQSQRIQYACGAEQVEVLTFVNGDFARTEFVYKGGDEVNVFGRVGDYYFVGANEQNIPYYVNWLYVCTQRAAVYFTPTPKLRPSSTPATLSQDPVWIAEFHTMQDRVLTICAKDAEVRGGPSNSYPILEHMNLADEATAFGWVRDWFYLGRDKSEQDYFIHNSLVCALEQTKPSQGQSPQPGSTSDPLTDYLRRQGYGTNNAPLPFPAFSQQDYLSSTPCDTYAYNQWAKGKSDRFVPECTPTPSAP